MFRSRYERVDWRKVAAADVEQIARTMDFDALQENIVNVAFCCVENELVWYFCEAFWYGIWYGNLVWYSGILSFF